MTDVTTTIPESVDLRLRRKRAATALVNEHCDNLGLDPRDAFAVITDAMVAMDEGETVHRVVSRAKRQANSLRVKQRFNAWADDMPDTFTHDLDDGCTLHVTCGRTGDGEIEALGVIEDAAGYWHDTDQPNERRVATRSGEPTHISGLLCFDDALGDVDKIALRWYEAKRKIDELSHGADLWDARQEADTFTMNMRGTS